MTGNQDLLLDARIRNVYSRQEDTSSQTKGVKVIHKFAQKTYWFVEEDAEGCLTIQAINENQVPAGNKRSISFHELQSHYVAEPRMFCDRVLPRMQWLEQTLERAERHRQQVEHEPAKAAYDEVLAVDEANIRANFGEGLIALAEGDLPGAARVFKLLVSLEDTFEPRHKHLFNEFGISLRKNSMYKQSVDYYTRAIEISGEDENLHVNIARPLYELRRLAECVQHLVKAIVLDGKNETAIKFLGWLRHGQCVPKEYEEQVDRLLALHRLPEKAAAVSQPAQDTAASAADAGPNNAPRPRPSRTSRDLPRPTSR